MKWEKRVKKNGLVIKTNKLGMLLLKAKKTETGDWIGGTSVINFQFRFGVRVQCELEILMMSHL